MLGSTDSLAAAASDERGEVASWLLLVAALALATAAATGVLTTTIGELASRVGVAAGSSTTIDPSNQSPVDAGQPASADDADAITPESAGDGSGTVESGGIDSAEVQRISEIQQRIGTGDHPGSAAAQIELENAVLALFADDPAAGQAVLDLVRAGASIEAALAEVTGDWSGIVGGDPMNYGPDELRTIVEILGLEVPDGPLPDDVNALVEALPNWLLAELFKEGRAYGFETPLAGVGTPGTVLPANVSAELVLTGSTSLSDPRVGTGFDQTQSVEISTELLANANFSAGKSTVGKAYKWLDRFSAVPGPIQDALQRSPLLRGLVRGLPFSFSYDQFEGVQFTYEATINREQGIQLDAGYVEVLPNIFDPSTFQEGNSVLISGGEVEGSTFALKYKALYGETTHTSFDGLGFGVTRLPDGRFAVYSGPIEILENELFVGLPVAGVVSTTTLSTNEFDYAELDLSTLEGQAAFDEFVTGGGVPSTDGVGVRTATTEVLTVDDQLAGEIRLGPLSQSSVWRDESSQMTITTWSDNQQDFNAGFEVAGAAFEVIAPINPDGLVDFDSSTMTMVFENIDEGTTGGLNYTFNNAVGVEGSQHVQIEFTASELTDLIGTAQQSVENRGFPSALPTDLVAELADATTPNEAMHLMIAHTRTFGATSTAQQLTTLANSVTGGLDGSIETRPAN